MKSDTHTAVALIVTVFGIALGGVFVLMIPLALLSLAGLYP